MIKKILKFYNETKLRKKNSKNISLINKDSPIGFVYIFHKKYPRMQSIPFSREKNKEGELESLLVNRFSTREFSKEPIKLDELEKVLSSIRIIEKDKFFERRTYPSGGARFPIEVYPIVFNVEGLDNGVYHYNFIDDTFETLWKTDLSDNLQEIVSEPIKNPSVSIFMTSVLSRSEIKYGIKAFGYSLLEAGHMAQNLSLMAERLGLGYCPVAGFIDDEMIKILDIVNDEIPIYSIVLGKKNEN